MNVVDLKVISIKYYLRHIFTNIMSTDTIETLLIFPEEEVLIQNYIIENYIFLKIN